MGALLLAIFAVTFAHAQVDSLLQDPIETSEGSVDSLLEHELSDPLLGELVYAEGVATVYGGDVALARKTALQAAYAEAIASGAGLEISSMTVIRNVQQISDIVTSRARGAITSYTVVFDELNEAATEIRVGIEARVATHSQSSEDESLAALRIFLEILGNPKIMVLIPQFDATLPASGQPTSDSDTARVRIAISQSTSRLHNRDYAGSPTASVPLGALRGTDAAIAQALNGFGYHTSTLDSVRDRLGQMAEQLSAAALGETAAALSIARESGAEALIVGNLVVATRRISPAGVEFEQATGELSARAFIVSTGEEVRTFHATSTRSHTNMLAAISDVKTDMARRLAQELAWDIPELLADSPHRFRVEIGGVSTVELRRVVQALTRLDGVIEARVLSLPDVSGRHGVIEVDMGFVRVPPLRLVRAIESSLTRPAMVERSTTHGLRISTT